MNKNALSWHSITFENLTPGQLHRILKLRQDVFVIEQDCIYPDIDELDLYSLHVFASDDKSNVIAYLRLVPPVYKYKEPSIGRVVIAAQARGSGLGWDLMRHGLAQSDRLYPNLANRISAQSHLSHFYSELGYQCVSDEYDEDGIPHVEMVRASHTS